MLSDFVSDLRRLPPLDRAEADMARLLEAIASGPSTGPALPRRPADYTRTCAYADERFEVVLLDWSAGAVSAIHDHGGQHCWLVVAQGRLRVDDFERVDDGLDPGKASLAARGSRVLGVGGLDLRSGPHDIHRVCADEHAVSLHVYARPLNEFLVYDERTHRCSRARGAYDRRLSLFAGAPAR